MEKFVSVKGSRGAGSWKQEGFLLKMDFPNDGVLKPYKPAILVLLLDLFKPVLLNTNITGIRNYVLTVKHPFEKDGKFIGNISGLKHICNCEI